MHGPSQPGPLARRLTRADPAGLLYGAIVTAAALGTVSLHAAGERVAIAAGVVLVVYWMADLYVHAISVRFDGDTHGLVHRLGVSARHKSSVLKGGVPGIVVFVTIYAIWDDSSTAAFAALGASIVLLTTAGYLGARQAGTPARAAMVEGVGAGLLGVVIVVFKALLH